MEFYDDYSEEFDDFFIDEKALQSKIDLSFKYLEEGQAVIQTDFIEETIQLCLDNEKFDTGLRRIKGVGAKRERVLIDKFGGVQNIRKASIEELCSAGIGRNTASAIGAYFGKKYSKQ